MVTSLSNHLIQFKLATVQKHVTLRIQSWKTQQTQNNATSTEKFSLELPHTIPDDRQPTTIDAQDELMQWHYHLNHLPFKCLFQLAKQG